MTAATVLVLFIIVVELYRPIVIGDAIDDYINGYYAPYIETTADAPGAVPYHDTYLTRDFEAADGQNYDQILLYNNQYYMAENLSSEECDALKNADAATLSSYVNQSATPLTRDDLKDLRHYDFAGILKAAALYLLLLLTGFVLNALDTWILQKMGQEIIYQMREEVFTHIHSLSLNFFNNTPVGKLVTRVSNDTEAVNELFSTILVKLFKNIVKIIGYAVVMLSINVKMALVSFALLPLVTVLTFFFRFMSRKAYELTRNRITDLNTFLSEHLSGTDSRGITKLSTNDNSRTVCGRMNLASVWMKCWSRQKPSTKNPRCRNMSVFLSAKWSEVRPSFLLSGMISMRATMQMITEWRNLQIRSRPNPIAPL